MNNITNRKTKIVSGDCLTQEEVNDLLKGVTGEDDPTDAPDDDWADAQADNWEAAIATTLRQNAFASAVGEPIDISDDDWAKAMVEQIDNNPPPFEETTIVPVSAQQNMLEYFTRERERLSRNVDEYFAALNTAIEKRELFEDLFSFYCKCYDVKL